MSRLSIPLIALAITLAGLSASTSAPAPKAGEKTADWPQFRGPNRDNISPDKNLLKKWPEKGPEVVWKSEGIGQGYSSVSVVGDKVFTMGDKEGSSYVYAIDRATGKQKWSVKVGKPEPGNWPGTRCTPTVDGELLYALGQHGDLVCLEVAKGEEKWRKNLKTEFGGNPGYWKYAESPLVDGDGLVCTPGGKGATIVKLDKRTGKEIWRSPLGDQANYSSIVIGNACGVKQYVQLTNGGTIGVAAKDGAFLWRYDRFKGNTANAPMPLIFGDQVFTAAGYGKGGAMLTLTATNGKFEVKEEYFKSELKNKHGGVTVVGDYIYADTDSNGRPYCANWKTGELEKWDRPKTSKGRGSASMTYADGNLYIRYENGFVALVPATPTGYTETGSFKMPNHVKQSWAYPVVIGGKMYLRENDIVWCYDVQGK